MHLKIDHQIIWVNHKAQLISLFPFKIYNLFCPPAQQCEAMNNPVCLSNPIPLIVPDYLHYVHVCHAVGCVSLRASKEEEGIHSSGHKCVQFCFWQCSCPYQLWVS